MASAASFNSGEFDWSDVTIQIGSRVLTNVQGVAYKRSQEKGFLYGKGNKPIAIQKGNYAFEGSIKVLQSELELLIANAPGKDLLAYRNMVVSVGYESETLQPVIDNLVGVEFTEVEKALEQGAMQMEVELPIMFLDVKYGV